MSKILAVFDIIPGFIWAVMLTIFALLLRDEITTGRAALAHAKAETASAVQTLETERRAASDAALTAQKVSQKREHELQAAADQDRKELSHEVQRIAFERDRALDELRKRPQRPAVQIAGTAVVPAPTGAGESAGGCTGAGLYREDAGFLVGEAARANQLGAYLKACYAGYDRARAAAKEVAPQIDDAASHQ